MATFVEDAAGEILLEIVSGILYAKKIEAAPSKMLSTAADRRLAQKRAAKTRRKRGQNRG